MSIKRINEVLSAGEGIAAEFKKARTALPENLFESVCAFSNRKSSFVKFFQQLGRAEELGSGIRNIRKYLPLYSENGAFELAENDVFKTILRFPEIVGESSEKAVGKTVEETVGKMSEKMSEKILYLIYQYPSISSSEIAKKLKKSSRTIERKIAELKKQNKIQRIGPAKGGHWEVIIKESNR